MPYKSCGRNLWNELSEYARIKLAMGLFCGVGIYGLGYFRDSHLVPDSSMDYLGPKEGWANHVIRGGAQNNYRENQR